MFALKALNGVVPGFEKAKLRNFGMTIGTRDSRKIIGRYDLTSEDVRSQAKFDDTIGVFPEFIGDLSSAHVNNISTLSQTGTTSSSSRAPGGISR